MSMNNAISPAAAGLVRCLCAAAESDKPKVLLREIHSKPWKSLTFAGERHTMQLSVPVAAAPLLKTFCEEGEFELDGYIVADIAVEGEQLDVDGRALLSIEALTVDE